LLLLKGSTNVNSEALNAYEHVADAGNLHARWVGQFEDILASVTKQAFQGVEPIADEEVEQVIIYAWRISLSLLGRLVLIDVSPKWLLESRFKVVKGGSLFEELEHGWLEAREGKELFHAHLRLGYSIATCS